MPRLSTLAVLGAACLVIVVLAFAQSKDHPRSTSNISVVVSPTATKQPFVPPRSNCDPQVHITKLPGDVPGQRNVLLQTRSPNTSILTVQFLWIVRGKVYWYGEMLTAPAEVTNPFGERAEFTVYPNAADSVVILHLTVMTSCGPGFPDGHPRGIELYPSDFWD